MEPQKSPLPHSDPVQKFNLERALGCSSHQPPSRQCIRLPLRSHRQHVVIRLCSHACQFSLSSCLNLSVHAKPPPASGIQLPISLDNTALPPPLRHALIAAADLVLGTFFLTTRIVSIITGHLWGVVVMLSLYVMFATLASAVFHYCLSSCISRLGGVKSRRIRRSAAFVNSI